MTSQVSEKPFVSVTHSNRYLFCSNTEFIYPADWLGDQRLLYRAVERAEQSRSLDLPAIRRNGGRNRTEPIVAFGPAAGSGELNVSVVVAPIAPGFR